MDQQAEELTFFLLKGVPKTKFKIFDNGEVENGNSKTEAAVIGASHYSKFDIFGQQFTEVLACVELDPNEQIITQIKFQFATASNINLSFGDVHYSFQARIYPWKQGANELYGIQNLALQKRNKEGCIILNSEFPRKPGCQLPQTLIVVEIRKDDATNGEIIVCNTIHTYPDKKTGGKIVHTMSTVERKIFAQLAHEH
ncbi:MAG: DUF2617 family protein [bacterium]